MTSEQYARNRVLARAAMLVVATALLAAACASDNDDQSSEAQRTEAQSPTTTPESQAESQPGTASPGCAVDDALELLRSGLPTYDYEPAGSYEQLDIAAQVVVTGRAESAVRDETNGAAFVELSVEVVVELSGGDRPDIETLAWDATWADSSAPDPLAEPVRFENVHFVAFLSPWSGRRAGWNPGIEGLYLSCGADAPLHAVIADGRGPDDPENPTIAELAALLAAQRAQRQAVAAQQPGTEYNDEDLRQLREDAMRANPTRVEAIRDALVRFARGGELEADEIPLSIEVDLGLGTELDRRVERDELQDRQAWVIERPQGYAQFVGPFSAIEVLGAIETQVVVGEHDHCAGPPLSRPEGYEHHAQVSIQPAEGAVDSCIAWFAVDLFFDPQTLTISAVTLALFGP